MVSKTALPTHGGGPQSPMVSKTAPSTHGGGPQPPTVSNTALFTHGAPSQPASVSKTAPSTHGGPPQLASVSKTALPTHGGPSPPSPVSKTTLLLTAADFSERVKNNWHGVSGRNGLWMVSGAVLTFVAVPEAGPGRGTGTGREGRWLINSVLPKYDVPVKLMLPGPRGPGDRVAGAGQSSG